MGNALKLLAGTIVLAACSIDSTTPSPAVPDGPSLAVGSFLPATSGLVTRQAELEFLEVCVDYVMQTQAAPPASTQFGVNGPGAPAGANFPLAPGGCRDVWLIGRDGENVTVTETVHPGFTVSSVRYITTGGVPSSIGGTTDVTTSFISGFDGGTGELVVFTNTEEVRDVGCTLTQGYWKTHSSAGPAPYDNGWITTATPSGGSTQFYTSGLTWYELFWTPPAGGNVYIQLAHQYMAAKLNILNGASTTTAVDAAITAAESFFAAVTGPSSTLTTQQRNAAKAAAQTLASYNEGAIGPGHCN